MARPNSKYDIFGPTILPRIYEEIRNKLEYYFYKKKIEMI